MSTAESAPHRCESCYQRIDSIGISTRIMRELYNTELPISSTGLYRIFEAQGVSTTKVSVLQTCRNLADAGEIEKASYPGLDGWRPIRPEGTSPLAAWGVGIPTGPDMASALAQVRSYMPQEDEAMDDLVHGMRPAVWSKRITDPLALIQWVQDQVNCHRDTADMYIDMMVRKDAIRISEDYKTVEVPERYARWMERQRDVLVGIASALGEPMSRPLVRRLAGAAGYSRQDCEALADVVLADLGIES